MKCVLCHIGLTDFFWVQSVKIDQINQNTVKRNTLFAVAVFICLL